MDSKSCAECRGIFIPTIPYQVLCTTCFAVADSRLAKDTLRARIAELEAAAVVAQKRIAELEAELHPTCPQCEGAGWIADYHQISDNEFEQIQITCDCCNGGGRV